VAGANIQRVLNRDCEGGANPPRLPWVKVSLQSLNRILDGLLHPHVGFSFSEVEMDGGDVGGDDDENDVLAPKNPFSNLSESGA
jgi:hypothetical protein